MNTRARAVGQRSTSPVRRGNVGTLSAVCDIADDHGVAVFVDCRSAVIADQLTAAGVSPQRLRYAPTAV